MTAPQFKLGLGVLRIGSAPKPVNCLGVTRAHRFEKHARIADRLGVSTALSIGRRDGGRFGLGAAPVVQKCTRDQHLGVRVASGRGAQSQRVRRGQTDHESADATLVALREVQERRWM